LTKDDINDSPKLKKIALVDVRGIDIEEWVLKDGFDIIAESGYLFQDVDLCDEFCDYDEKGQVPVRVYNIKTNVERA
jgi:hypothetical protein